MNRIRAATAAEAGTALAMHHLAFMQSLPESEQPFFLSLDGDSAGWIELPDCGSFFVVIDPINGSTGLLNNGAVQVRSRGLAGDVTRDINISAAPSYPSSYALLTDNGIPEGYFIDGRIVNGPVHSNGLIHFSSYSPDSTDDPSVVMVSTAREGFSFSGGGITDVPHPEGSSVWVGPYSHHRQGSPYWRVSAPQVDFSEMYLHFRNLVTGSLQSNAVRITAERILIQGNSLLFKANRNAEQRTIDLTGVNLVIVRNGFHPVMVKTIYRPDHPLTIIATNDLVIGGTIDGGAIGAGGPLGLVALGDILIPADPDEAGGDDWPGRWAIETDQSFLIRACLVTPSGSFKAKVPYFPEVLARISLTGSLTQQTMGRISSGNSGYEMGNLWDPGLGALHPPYFPMLDDWTVYSWIIDPPEEEDFEIEDDAV